MSEIEGRAEFLEKLNRLVDDYHHYLYLIDGVFDGVRSIEKSVREYNRGKQTMKAKDKAMEIAMKFDKKGETDNAKQCALICVDEILNSHIDSVYEAYYLEVKQEIEKL